MNFLNADVWPHAVNIGVLQHDAFSCEGFAGGGRGFPRPRGGGEHVGGVYNNENKIREGDVGLLPAAGFAPACAPKDVEPSARTTVEVPMFDAQQCSDKGVRKILSPMGEQLAPSCLKTSKASVVFGGLSLWREVFIDTADYSTCAQATSIAPPPVFNYDYFLDFRVGASACGLRPSSAVTQFHTRFLPFKTHYDSLGPGGLRFRHDLVLAQGMFTSNIHFAYLYGITPMLSAVVQGRNATRILVPGLPAAEEAMEAAKEALALDAPQELITRLSLASGKAMSDYTWIDRVPEPPAMLWAHKLYVHALPDNIRDSAANMCASSSAQSLTDVSAPHFAAMYAAISSAATRGFAKARTLQCGALILAEASTATAAIAKPMWPLKLEPVTLNPCTASAAEQIAAVRNAALIVMPGSTLNVYLQHASEGTVVVFDTSLGAAPSQEMRQLLANMCAAAHLECVVGDASSWSNILDMVLQTTAAGC
jgi:hypothetical protein